MGGTPQYMDLAGAERHQYMLTSIFEHILYKFEVAIGVRAMSSVASPATGGSGSVGGGMTGMTGTMSNASVHSGSDKYEKIDKTTSAITNTDGVSAIAMLSVLSEFEASYREAVIVQYVTSSAGSTSNLNAGRPGMSVIFCVSCILLAEQNTVRNPRSRLLLFALLLQQVLQTMAPLVVVQV